VTHSNSFFTPELTWLRLKLVGSMALLITGMVLAPDNHSLQAKSSIIQNPVQSKRMLRKEVCPEQPETDLCGRQLLRKFMPRNLFSTAWKAGLHISRSSPAKGAAVFTDNYQQACTDSENCRILDNLGATRPGAGARYRIIITINQQFKLHSTVDYCILDARGPPHPLKMRATTTACAG
jgi:hypothetical protein